jgi:hypothetical protein
MASVYIPWRSKERECFNPVPKTKIPSSQNRKSAKARKRAANKEKRAPRGRNFNAFSHLPAEIRAKVWAIALQDQIVRQWRSDTDPLPRHTIDIHQYKDQEGIERVNMMLTRGYPSLFFVNREARYEAARVDGGAWYPLGVGATEVYANFDKEDVYIGCCLDWLRFEGSLLHKKAMTPKCFCGQPVTQDWPKQSLLPPTNHSIGYS